MSRAKGHGTGAPQNLHSLNFLKVVERTTDNFVGGDDTALADVHRILLQVRAQYDAVHCEAEQKEAQLKKIKEQTRAADASHGNRAEETQRLEDHWNQLEDKLQETQRRFHETQTNKKVYEHMLARIQREQSILKEKMLKMEQHMGRKSRELQQRITEAERSDPVQHIESLHCLERDAAAETSVCDAARKVMYNELERRKESNKCRADFESWRHEVALEAANEAFNASAGRLRKLYAIEKLAGNCLQKITF
jgi:predicted RNase H-like nuclease (RuvC/YqgF family)